ncbi:MAG: aldo/keto reductase [Anaerolineae bacterium]|nr:aldo/keto reductase [Anaerolineae bacterium]
MRYKLLGKSGLRVSELCLGAMTFGEAWHLGASSETSRQVFDLFGQAGGNFVDTANNYQDGQSETILGELIKANRDYWVVATKYTATATDQTDPNKGGNSRKTLHQKVEGSLRRLQTDYIDVLYVHVWDFITPIEEVMRGLDDVIRAGKVRYIAISDTPAWIVAEANARAELRGWSQFIGFQLPYSLIDRDIERAEIPLAKHWDMALLPFGALAGGLLSGKYASGEAGRLGQPKLDERKQRILDEVLRMATEIGTSPAQVALNWVRQQQDRAVIVPIIGARNAAQLADNLGCLDWSLSPDQMQRLDAVSRIDYGFTRDGIEGDLRQYVFGKTFDLTDNHRGYPR